MSIQRYGLWRDVLMVLIVALLLCTGKTARAAFYADVLDGSFSECRMTKVGESYEADFTVTFNRAAGNMAGQDFYSRGLVMFGYDAAGKRKRLGNYDLFLYPTINGVGSGGFLNHWLEFTAIYSYSSTGYGSWTNADAFVARIRLSFRPVAFENWPAIGVQPVNITRTAVPVFPKTGAFYMGLNMQGCQIINPENPPPSPVTTEIKVTAPDWDLGELERGKETTRTFATDAQRLCFSYDPKYIAYDKYLISASNRNGVAGNKFQLVAKANPDERVPYSLSLEGGGAPVALPSANGLPLTLGKSGRTCLTPTFKAWAGADLKSGGDFSDVLTFTIVTTP